MYRDLCPCSTPAWCHPDDSTVATASKLGLALLERIG